MIRSILVANRGEIARRVFRTCRSMGISTVAVYSDPDAYARHAVEADAAVRLPGETAAETYLRGDLIIEAALAAGADAVHPGYGFLSENAAFAQAVVDAGLVWIGPSPSAIEAMGTKTNAKKLMAAVGVPVMEMATVTEADLPVLVKASAGGGGRGMRVVRTMAELPGQLEAARTEAESAFGDPAVFCEPYVADGRHIEVQILADRHGTMWTVGERECSIQRRYQKIIEEAPSPLVDGALREKLYAAARAAATAVGYEGAGTVEFLVAPDGTFWFLEMNTRLQVEHPVTEAVTGLDLVREQIAIARGDRLAPEPPESTGYAIEARLYAEDAAGRPQTGVLQRFHVPAEHVRVDAGYAEGDAVGVHYDPLLAKVIAWAPTRTDAAAALAGALASARIHGVGTNRDLLIRILRQSAFLDGSLADFMGRHIASVVPPLASPSAERLSAVAAALAGALADREGARVLSGLPTGWRNLPSAPQRRSYEAPSGRIDVEYAFTRSGVSVAGLDATVGAVRPDSVDLILGGVRRTFAVARYPRRDPGRPYGMSDEGAVFVDSALGSVTLTPVPRFPSARAELASGSLTAPMPGTVVRVAVAAGDRVDAGQPLLWLEAMKMQHEITAPAAGMVTGLAVAVGSQVEVGAVLAVVTPDAKEER
jgi:propionyl-CoA carboxylase alpha chain